MHFILAVSLLFKAGGFSFTFSEALEFPISHTMGNNRMTVAVSSSSFCCNGWSSNPKCHSSTNTLRRSSPKGKMNDWLIFKIVKSSYSVLYLEFLYLFQWCCFCRVGVSKGFVTGHGIIEPGSTVD